MPTASYSSVASKTVEMKKKQANKHTHLALRCSFHFDPPAFKPAVDTKEAIWRGKALQPLKLEFTSLLLDSTHFFLIGLLATFPGPRVPGLLRLNR